MKPETLMEWGALPKQGSMIADWAKTILALYPTVTLHEWRKKGVLSKEDWKQERTRFRGACRDAGVIMEPEALRRGR